MSNFFEHIQDGVSQTERQLEALMPAYVKVDDRSPHELLQLLTRLSAHIHYYNFQNRQDGSWEDFFHADLMIMLVITGALDFTPYETAFLRLREQLDETEDNDVLFRHTRELFILLYDIAIVMMDVLHKLREADREYRIWRYLEQLMESLEADMLLLSGYEPQVVSLFPAAAALHGNSLRTPESVPALRRLYPRIFAPAAAEQPLFEGFYSLNEIYDNLRARFYQISSSANYYLHNQLQGLQHSPHMGLLITFVELYRHLQEQINGLPKRHLDFYYRQVLGLLELKAVADRVAVFIEPVPHTYTLNIEKGAILLANPNARQEPLHYRLLDRLKVHNTRIMALRTLFVSDYLQMASPTLQYQDVREAQVYVAAHPIIAPKDYVKENTTIRTWPLLGEDQHDLTQAQRTMEDMSMGFIIGSPVLYLTEGNRLVQVKLYFEPGSFRRFIAYVRNFARVSRRSEAITMSQLLGGAFLVYFTTSEGWAPVKRFNVRSNIDDPSSNCIEINFQLDATTASWSAYDSKAHGGDLGSSLPLMKVLLNNNSFHHPYSFLRRLTLERVGITSRVTGHRGFRLYNNVGEVSSQHAFQLFGPQPSVGAYLDIRNSNIFNRYTRSFSIRMEWLNLPRHVTGFDAYYRGYEADLNNPAFKIGISSLVNGIYYPERNQQQQLELFQTTRDKEGDLYLSDVTVLKNVDFARLPFVNNMLLDRETMQNAAFYKEGAVRVELLGPTEAFGHRLFAKVFPEVVMYNARLHWLGRKKKPVPNLPYVPMVNALSIDYTLEHTEALKTVQSPEGGDGLEVYHAVSYGYRKLYPVAGESSFPLVAVFDHMANLYIGFDNLHPGEELSLLFQLEEKHYADTVTGIAPIKWSYLSGNKWHSFEGTHILSDDTNNLLNSGIVKLRVPEGVSNGNTLLDATLYWIRISAETFTGANMRVAGIFPNAVMAEREMDEQGTTLEEVLSIPPLSIRKFKSDIKTIQHVWQLFPSFGGRRRESEAQYYARVSERLRHKQRPVQSFDIAQVLLQQFPELLIVKCLPVAHNPQHLSEQPDVSIIVVRRPRNGVQFSTLEPKVELGTLYRIQEFIAQTVSPFIKAEVRNPVYERVKVVCKVKFNDASSRNDNLYLQRLYDDIQRYLCPWLFDASSYLKIGSVLYKSEMLNYINRLPYIGYVTGFSLVHFYQEKDVNTGRWLSRATDTALTDVPFIRASVPQGVLIPASRHLISVLEGHVYEDPYILGINSLQVSSELIVNKNGAHGGTAATGQHAGPADDEMITLSIQPE